MNPVKNIFSALLLFLLLPVMDVSGQIEAGKRLEFELREGYENFDLAQFRENGILVFYHAEKSVKDNKVIVYCTSKKSKMLRVLDFKSGAENDVAFSIEEYEPNDVSLLNIQVDDDSQELYFFFNAKFEKSYQLYVMRFNDEAELQEKINLSEDSPWVFST